MRIVGEHGPIFNAELNVNVAKTQAGPKYIPLTNKISNLKFEEEGIYCVEIMINGQLKRNQDLSIRLAK